MPADLVEREEGRPVAYVALHGHGTYPKVHALSSSSSCCICCCPTLSHSSAQAGIWRRAGFFANDQTSRDGAYWKPHTCKLLPAVQTGKLLAFASILSTSALG